MLRKQPKSTPAYREMLADLGHPSPQEVAQCFGVSVQTARAWARRNDAPRAAMLALFWVTSWGQQWAEADAHNAAQAYRGLAMAYKREIGELHKQKARLMSIADFGSANDPVRTATKQPVLMARPRLEHINDRARVTTATARPISKV